METFTQHLSDYLTVFETFVAENAQAGIDLALLYARVDAASLIVSGFFAILIVYTFGAIMADGAARYHEEYLEGNGRAMDSGWDVATFCIRFVSYVISIIIFLSTFLNVFRWAGIFYPEVWVVHKLLGMAASVT